MPHLRTSALLLLAGVVSLSLYFNSLVLNSMSRQMFHSTSDSNVDSIVDSYKNLRKVESEAESEVESSALPRIAPPVPLLPTGMPTTKLVEIAIIIPYRDREVHLRRFKEYMATYVQEHHIDVNMTIWGIEQHDSNLFNRGWLTNVGITEVMKTLPGVQCIVQHDVDRFPKNYVDYKDCETPIQLSAENDQFNGGLPYDRYAGGVVSLSPKHWKLINGMSNDYHGWGGEDDDLFFRLQANGLLTPSGLLRRPKKGMGQFSEWHDEDHTNRVSPKKQYSTTLQMLKKMSGGSTRWKTDGLNSLKYEICGRPEYENGVHHLFVERPPAAPPVNQ